MSRIVLLLILTFYFSSTAALLPPYYESSNEIIAILKDPIVSKKITSGRMIHSIVKTDAGYTINTQDCTLNVHIHYLSNPAGFVGPAQFEIESEEISCQ